MEVKRKQSCIMKVKRKHKKSENRMKKRDSVSKILHRVTVSSAIFIWCIVC
jgi:hypothetical protein